MRKPRKKRFIGKTMNRFSNVIKFTRKFFQKLVNTIEYDLWEEMHSNDISKSVNTDKAAIRWFEKFRGKHRYSGFLQPAQLYMFDYDDPLTKDTLEFWDNQPLVIAFGDYINKEGIPRERGISLHLLPLEARKVVMYRIFNLYKMEYLKNTDMSKPISFEMDWQSILSACKDVGVDFACRMYAVSQRTNTVRIPMDEWHKAIWIPSKGYTGTTLMELETRWKEFTKSRNVPASVLSHIKR